MDQMATYCPEDNKLRLYVGRVPREEFMKLRAQGWTCTPKQREAGGCDFVAHWTPERRDTALEYGGGIILDEDQSPEERAADRAERFGGYCDKRTAEATGHADRYDAGPNVHGYQSQARAERAAGRHDRIGSRAVDAWSKAEYWQQRTAGVISHALYKSRPDVRMGRIKVLEAELRKHLAHYAEHNEQVTKWEKIQALTDPEKQTRIALGFAGICHMRSKYMHPRAATSTTLKEYHKTNALSLYCLLSNEEDPITGAEACALYFSDHRKIDPEQNEWTIHYRMRLAYENQMLEAQGGRLAHEEIQVGGRLGSHLIVKVCKSNVTGRVVSVWVKGEKIRGYTYQAKDIVGAAYSLHQIETERLAADAYTAPTPESLKELAEHEEGLKAAKSKIKPVPLINPTEEDAAKLQAIWNEAEEEPGQVVKMTQAQYSALSAGTYGAAETVIICETGREHRQRYGKNITRESVFKVRKRQSGDYNKADGVIVITDKPQKPLPWAELAKARAKHPTIESFRPRLLELVENMRGKSWCKDVDQTLFKDAQYLGLAYYDSESQYGLTDKGRELLKELAPA